MDFTKAQNIIVSNTNTNPINLADVFKNLKGVQFATLDTVTPVNTSAKSPLKGKIVKVGAMRVQLAGSLKEHTSVYKNAVEKETGLRNFKVSESNYKHMKDTFCVQALKSNPSKLYMYAICGKGSKAIYINTVTNTEMTREEVAAEMTPSSAKRLLNPQPTWNDINEVEHNVTVRSIKLENVASIHFGGNVYTGKFDYK